MSALRCEYYRLCQMGGTLAIGYSRAGHRMGLFVGEHQVVVIRS